MRVLVTGGSGFLGSRLIRELLERGHDTMNFDRQSHETLELTRLDRLWRTFGELSGEFIPDIVVHSAGMPGRLFCEQDYEQAVRDNVIATTETSQACARMRYPMIFLSTSEVYGISCDEGQVDEASLLQPRNHYGRTKVIGEQVARHYLGDAVTIVRPSMSYGPSMAVGYGRAALPTFIANAIGQRASRAHPGTQRSWCYVDDLVRGLADVLEIHDGGVYNVGRDDDLIDTYDLARMIYRLMHCDPQLIEATMPEDSITPTKDISCARLRELGWAPRVSLNEGIARTADWLRSEARKAPEA